MEGVYDWQKPLEIPRHDEPEAEKKLHVVMEQAIGRLKFPKSEGYDGMEKIQHPDTDVMVLGFMACGRSRKIFDVPLRVEVFPQDSIRRRRRAYIFHPDGRVIVEAERGEYHVSSSGPDMVEAEQIVGWPEGVRHMLRYVVQVMRASAGWEIQLAESLEILAPVGNR